MKGSQQDVQEILEEVLEKVEGGAYGYGDGVNVNAVVEDLDELILMAE